MTTKIVGILNKIKATKANLLNLKAELEIGKLGHMEFDQKTDDLRRELLQAHISLFDECCELSNQKVA